MGLDMIQCDSHRSAKPQAAGGGCLRALPDRLYFPANLHLNFCGEFMPAYTTADIRNVLIAGHGGSGKTTLVDALLLASGTVNRKASVLDGSSFSDFEKEEKEHK